MSVTIGALRESAPQETRVSVVPEVADKENVTIDTVYNVWRKPLRP